MNFHDLVTSLDPHYRAKVSFLQQEMGVKAQFERFRADEAMNREQFKAGEAMRREQYKTQEENNRLNRRFSFEEQLERQAHENRLLQMEENLKGSIMKSGFDSMLGFLQKTAEEEAQKHRHTQEQFTIRTNLRADVFKMLAGAVIQEKLAQKQHERDKENRVWAMTEAYLLQTYKTAGERETRSEIDRLVDEWERMT